MTMDTLPLSFSLTPSTSCVLLVLMVPNRDMGPNMFAAPSSAFQTNVQWPILNTSAIARFMPGTSKSGGLPSGFLLDLLIRSFTHMLPGSVSRHLNLFNAILAGTNRTLAAIMSLARAMICGMIVCQQRRQAEHM